MRVEDRNFEQQFQWEADRWVFRYRHRGDPIEVTLEERDRLVERHLARRKFGSRMVGLGFGVTFLLCFLFPRQAYLAPIVLWLGMLVGMLALHHWADDDVTAHLRKRAPIGLRLGVAGRVARRAQALRWRDLCAAIAYLALVSGMTAATVRDHAMMGIWGIGFMAVEAAIGVLLLWMVLMKFAQRERQRLHDEATDAVRRSRELR